MSLTPGEQDRLLLFLQGELARARRNRGLLLNIPEATALIADSVVELARDGLTLDEVRLQAREILSVKDVLPIVPQLLTEIRVEARFDDGTRLVVVRDPFNQGTESIGESSDHAFPADRIEGELLKITNTASIAIGVSSHIHLAEVNPRLRLDRSRAWGMHIAVKTGDATWIEPNEVVEVALTPIEGNRVMLGNSGVVDGPLDDPEVRERALATLRSCGYLDERDGEEINSPDLALGAVHRLMSHETQVNT